MFYVQHALDEYPVWIWLYVPVRLVRFEDCLLIRVVQQIEAEFPKSNTNPHTYAQVALRRFSGERWL